MSDPLADVVALLQPTARYSKRVDAAGRWRVRRSESGQPFYCAVLEGRCRLEVAGQPPLLLEAGEFVLVPAAHEFSTSSVTPPPDGVTTQPVALGDAYYQLGDAQAPVEVQLLVGNCVLASAHAALLVSLLPQVVHVRNEKRLATLVQWVREEFNGQRPGREEIVARLLEVVFIETLRAASTTAPPGLVRGLAEPRLAVALRLMHAQPGARWTVEQLARAAALSRSAFFERFSREVGVAPMEYLLAWRMALAKRWLAEAQASIGDIAERVGYSSASAFSVAFNRHVGIPPGRYSER